MRHRADLGLVMQRQPLGFRQSDNAAPTDRTDREGNTCVACGDHALTSTHGANVAGRQGHCRRYGMAVGLPLVSREWKNGSNSSYNCTPFLHSLLTKGKLASRLQDRGVPEMPQGFVVRRVPAETTLPWQASACYNIGALIFRIGFF